MEHMLCGAKLLVLFPAEYMIALQVSPATTAWEYVSSGKPNGRWVYNDALHDPLRGWLGGSGTRSISNDKAWFASKGH